METLYRDPILSIYVYIDPIGKPHSKMYYIFSNIIKFMIIYIFKSYL